LGHLLKGSLEILLHVVIDRKELQTDRHTVGIGRDIDRPRHEQSAGPQTGSFYELPSIDFGHASLPPPGIQFATHHEDVGFLPPLTGAVSSGDTIFLLARQFQTEVLPRRNRLGYHYAA
jgi:hypothetical protein